VVRAHDPEAMENVKKVLGNRITFHEDPYLAADGADALFIATEWPEFRTPDFERLGKLLKNKVIFDGRNLYEPSDIRELGYRYISIGRQTI
jgi:UDPglucose 6-dehydrogenase